MNVINYLNNAMLCKISIIKFNQCPEFLMYHRFRSVFSTYILHQSVSNVSRPGNSLLCMYIFNVSHLLDAFILLE